MHKLSANFIIKNFVFFPSFVVKNFIAGNLTRSVKNGTINKFFYNAQNKLVKIYCDILNPGTGGTHFVTAFEFLYDSQNRRIGIIRGDAIYGIGLDITELIEHSLSFLLKGKDPRTAKRILRKLNPSYDDWKRVDETTWAFDAKYVKIRNCPYPVRTVITKGVNAKGKLDYRHIYTSFSPRQMDEVETTLFRRKRIDIEAVIRDDKHGLYIDNLRTKNFWGIWVYLLMACATHNLISLFRDRVLRGTGIEDLGIQTIVKKLADIPAKLEKEQNKMTIFFPAGHELARRFIRGKQDNHKCSIFLVEQSIFEALLA